MNDTKMNNLSLVLDLTEWVAMRPRTYREAMTTWRTSCPRLTIWEDAIDAGLIQLCHRGATESTVVVTVKGVEFMRSNGRALPARGRFA
jgi:hypothetical protein